jgi:hypothetical protein
MKRFLVENGGGYIGDGMRYSRVNTINSTKLILGITFVLRQLLTNKLYYDYFKI